MDACWGRGRTAVRSRRLIKRMRQCTLPCWFVDVLYTPSTLINIGCGLTLLLSAYYQAKLNRFREGVSVCVFVFVFLCTRKDFCLQYLTIRNQGCEVVWVAEVGSVAVMICSSNANTRTLSSTNSCINAYWMNETLNLVHKRRLSLCKNFKTSVIDVHILWIMNAF